MATPTSRTLSVLLGLLAVGTRLPAAPAPEPPLAQIQIQGLGGGQIRVEGGQLRIEGGRVQIMAAPAAGQEAKPGYLGLLLEETVFEDIDPAEPEAKDDAKENHGAGILRVVDGTPAAQAGMLDGDRVMILDGKKIKNSAQFRELIRAGKPDQAVKMTIRREGKDIEVKAKLGAAPDNAVVMQFGALDGSTAPAGDVVFYRKPTSAPLAGEKPGGNLDKVFLRDGNRLAGKVQSVDPEKGVALQREGVSEIQLRAAGIGMVQFADRAAAESAPPRAILALRDGSWFGGEALTMEQGKISLTLPGGQRLVVPRQQAQSVTLADGPAPQTYEGPVSMAGWSGGTSGMGRWDYKAGFLRCLSNGPLGRNIERMPDPLDLSFEVIYPAQAQVFNVSLFAGPIESTPAPGTFTLQFHPQYIQGSHFDGIRQNQYRAAGPSLNEEENGKPTACRYRLLVDRVNGHALIYVNGIKRADWKLAKIKAGDVGKCASGLVFTPQTYNANLPFQIGRVRVRPWDGQEPANGLESADPQDDQVLIARAAAREGRIERITSHEIILANQGAIPRREQPLFLRFVADPETVAALPPATALVRLKSGGEFAVTEIRGNGETVAVTTRFGAALHLPVSALRSLDFVPPDGQPESDLSGLDVLTMTDGSQLKGKLVTPMAGDRLRWKIAAAETALEFPRNAVAGVLFPKAEASSEAATLRGASAVRLSNGDWLPGEIVSLNERQLVLRNSLSGELILPTHSLRSLYVSSEVARSLADGASGPEPWSKGSRAERASFGQVFAEEGTGLPESWSYHDGTYSLVGSSRFSGLGLAHQWTAYPGGYAVNLELETADVMPSLQIQLFNTKEQPTINVYCPGNGRVYVGFNTVPDGLNGARFGNKEFSFPRSREKKLRISLVLDVPGRNFRMIFDGKEVGRIAFKEAEARATLDIAGINITPQGGRKLCRVSNLWLAPWSGPSDRGADPTGKQDAGRPAAEPQKNAREPEVIYLANGDEATGKVEGIEANLMTVNTEVGSLALPLQRVAWLQFPGPEVPRSEDAIHLRFHDRGVLTVKELHIENDRVACQTSEGQALVFPLALVKELVYQPAR